MQTFHLAVASGAKLKSGGDLKITDLWRLNSDEEENITVPSWAKSSLELRQELIDKQRKQNDTVRNNS